MHTKQFGLLLAATVVLVLVMGLGVAGCSGPARSQAAPVDSVPTDSPSGIPGGEPPPDPTVTATNTMVAVSSTPTLPAATSMEAPSATLAGTLYTQLAILPTQPPFVSPTPTSLPKPRVVRMQLPSIGVDAKVIEVGWHFVTVNGVEQVKWDDASQAVGHVMGSADPGEGGNIIFSGHNNIEGAVFGRLWKLQVGDEAVLTNAKGETYKYRVSEARIVKEKYASGAQRAANARYLDPTPSERVTLISCYPPTNNTDRVLVVAIPEG
jgi:sortase A